MSKISYKKHPFENSKLVKVQHAIEAQWQTKRRAAKNYIRASKAIDRVRQTNNNVETLYHMALPKIKAEFAKLDKYDRIAVEINLKAHPTNMDELYALSFSTFIFDLCCDVQNNYFVRYRFHNCTIEAEIRALMHRFSLVYFLRQDTKIVDYKSYFERVLKVQPERFITLL